MILTLQASSTPASIEFFKLVSDIGVSLGFLAIGITYIWASRARALYYVILYVLMVFIMCTFKIGYHDPRPYMTDSDVQVYGCSTEFGNPSGHAMTASSVMITIFLDYFFSDPTVYINTKKWVYYLALFLNISFILLSGFSRLYNGVHTLD